MLSGGSLMFQFFKRKKVPKVMEKCPCCGYYILDERGVYDICPVCFWEDNLETEDPDKYNEVNKLSLNEARANYLAFGACDKRLIKYVRKPKECEKECIENKEKSN